MSVGRRLRRLLFCRVIPLHVGYLEIDHEARRHYFKCTRCGAELDDLGPEYDGNCYAVALDARHGARSAPAVGGPQDHRIVVGRCPTCGYEVEIAEDTVQFGDGCPDCGGYIDWTQGVTLPERWR